MAKVELKTKKNNASVAGFLASVEPEEKKQDAKALLVLFKKVTGLKPTMWGDSMVGFGSYHYKYASGQEGDWFQTGFSPRKQALTIYLIGCMYSFDKVKDLLAKLGPHKLGKGCLYIKRLADVDLAVLKKLVKASVASFPKE